jgi:YVTN family beta-propeller protein
MYPSGIDIPGYPLHSHYRSLELDDEIGLQTLYPPVDWSLTTGTLDGVVHNNRDEPLFGGHVVARNVANDVEVGTFSGMVLGPYQAQHFRLPGLPPGTYAVRVDPVDFLPPGSQSCGGEPNVTPGQIGVINPVTSSVWQQKFPDEPDLDTSHFRCVFNPNDATPIVLLAGQVHATPFRPVGFVDVADVLLRPARPFDFVGGVNAEACGLASAEFVYSVDRTTVVTQELPLDAPYSVPVPLLPTGSRVDYQIVAENDLGQELATISRTLQVGLSGEPLVFVSETFGHSLSVYDPAHMLRIDETSDGLSFPWGQAMHYGRNALYVANFGTDNVAFVPLFDETLPPTSPFPFDTDGDGLLNALEPVFATDAGDPDTDGDLNLDGTELSELEWGGFGSVFEVLGGTLSSDGSALGRITMTLAVWNVTQNSWVTSVLPLPPSGRFRVRLHPGDTYRGLYYDAQNPGPPIAATADWTGSVGQTIAGGVTTLPLPPLDPPVPDTGTDPLNTLDGGEQVFESTAATISLPESSDPMDVALGLSNQQYLYVTTHANNRVYKIDTSTNQVAASVSVSGGPKGIAVSPDGSKVYVARLGGSSVRVLDGSTLATLANIGMPGSPHYVRLTPDGSKAVVTVEGSNDLVFVDTATNSVIEAVDSGTGHPAIFLSQANVCDERMLAGPYFQSTSDVAWVDTLDRSVEVLDLSGAASTTSVALHHDGRRGYVADFDLAEVTDDAAELFEIDLHSRIVLGAYALPASSYAMNVYPDPDTIDDPDGDGIDAASDNCPCTPNLNQWDYDQDGYGDACDNCPFYYSLDRSDLNGNGYGDVCECCENPGCNPILPCDDGIPCTLDQCFFQIGNPVGMCKITSSGC